MFVAVPTAVTIYASDGGAYYKNVISVYPAGLQSFTLPVSTVQGGSSVSGSVMGSGLAIGIVSVSFASGNSTIVTPPAPQILIGVAPVIVSFATNAVPADHLVNVVASTSFSRIQRSILVLAPRVQSLSFDKASVQQGGTATLTVTLTGPAPLGGTTVYVTGVWEGETVTEPAIIPAGQSSASVTEVALPVTKNTVLTVFAKGYAGSAASTSITVTP